MAILLLGIWEQVAFAMNHYSESYVALRNFRYKLHLAMKACMSVSVIIALAGCIPSSIRGQDDASGQPSRDTNVLLPETEHFSSDAMGISFDIPEGWVTEETTRTIYLAQSSAHLPWGADFFLTPDPELYFEIYTAPAYLDSVEQGQKDARTALELAREIAYSFEVGPVRGTLIGGIKREVINNAEAAILLLDTGEIYSYVMVMKISEDRAIVINGMGNPNSKTKLTDVADLIANTLRYHE